MLIPNDPKKVAPRLARRPPIEASYDNHNVEEKNLQQAICLLFGTMSVLNESSHFPLCNDCSFALHNFLSRTSQAHETRL